MNRTLTINCETFSIDKLNKKLYSTATYKPEEKEAQMTGLNAELAQKIKEFYNINMEDYGIEILDDVFIISDEE